jgi:hypothetical protein
VDSDWMLLCPESRPGQQWREDEVRIAVDKQLSTTGRL